jgi:hypothetical protein
MANDLKQIVIEEKIYLTEGISWYQGYWGFDEIRDETGWLLRYSVKKDTEKFGIVKDYLKDIADKLRLELIDERIVETSGGDLVRRVGQFRETINGNDFYNMVLGCKKIMVIKA